MAIFGKGVRIVGPVLSSTWKMQSLFTLNKHQHRTMSAMPNEHNPQDATSSKNRQPAQFDENMLRHLVCPLSKKDLRYDKQKNELVCDDLGVAYPIIDGIPSLVPEDARTLSDHSEKEKR